MLPKSGPFDNVSQLKEDDSLFSEEFPYMLWKKKYKGSGEKIMLHYHESYEIIISENLKGERIIEGNKFDLSGQRVFVIPPWTLHSANIEPNSGESIILKFSVDLLNRYININKIFASEGLNVNHVPLTCEFYQGLIKPVRQLQEMENVDIFDKLIFFISIFRILSESCTATEKIGEKSYNEKIRKIIDWTNEHYENKISLEEAARYIGLSKNYFCKYFKQTTRSTYIEYLNQVKIENALKMLKEGKSVTEVCYNSGFDNLSYFIQLFKKTYGVTPKKYVMGLTS